MKVAVLYGSNGQTGSYMCELLLERGYKVVACIRRSSTNTLERLKAVKDHPNLEIVESDITDPVSVSGVVGKYKPDELYNFAAQSHVQTSFKNPHLTFEVNTLGVLNILEAIKNLSPTTKFLNMCTSEQFGSNYDEDIHQKYQDENTKFAPNSPYAVSKLAAFELCRLYNKSYGTFSCPILCFNHESERRGENFVTRKITKYIGQLVAYLNAEQERYNSGQYWEPADLLGKKFPKLQLGNVKASRDWSAAQDICEAVYLVMQEEHPDYYVVSSDETRTVEDFLDAAFGFTDLKWQDYVEINPEFYRPCEVEHLHGRSTKIRTKLGWKPRYTFDDLVRSMVNHDVKEAANGVPVPRLY